MIMPRVRPIKPGLSRGSHHFGQVSASASVVVIVVAEALTLLAPDTVTHLFLLAVALVLADIAFIASAVTPVLALVGAAAFQAAARRLGITPSGLTQSIQRLEIHYGRPLFQRSRAGVALTAAGEVAVEGARAIIRRAEAVEREIKLVGNPETGHLSVGIDPTLANLLLAPVLASFLGRYPSMRFTVTSDNRPALLSMLAERAIELLVCYPDRESKRPGVESVELTLPSPIVVGRPGHPLTLLADRKISRYLQYPRLGARLPAWYVAWADYQLAREGLETSSTEDYYLYSDNLTLMKSVVQQSDAVMGLYPQDAEAELAAGQLVEMNPLDWPQQAPVEVVHAAERPLSMPAEVLVQALVEKYAGRQ